MRLVSATSALPLRLASSAASSKPAPSLPERSNSKPHKGISSPLTPSTSAPGQSPAVEQHASTSHDSLLEPLPSVAATAEPFPVAHDKNMTPLDWSTSYHGLSVQPFAPESAKILMEPIDPNDVEIKPGTFGPFPFACATSPSPLTVLSTCYMACDKN
jgi:Mitochondrial genome maintenance MGM101